MDVFASKIEHLEWLKAREMVIEAKNAEIEKAWLLAKEGLLKKRETLHNFLYKASRIKNKQSLINIMKTKQD